MGTNGMYVFLYNKKYYIFFKGMDSYPEGLGKLLVKEINSWTPEYIENLKKLILKINECRDCYCGFENLEQSVKNYKNYSHYTRTVAPSVDGNAEWIYTIDLDNTQFIVEWVEYKKNKIVFNLENIPESWINNII